MRSRPPVWENSGVSQKYQYFFLDAQGRILARQEFIAGDDDDARSIARPLNKNWTAAARYEVWRGLYCLKAAVSVFCSCLGLDLSLAFF
jgi:hypothetical protein